MTLLTIKLPTDQAATPCKLCGRGTFPAAGPNLCLSDEREVVCQECGRKHAPALAALLDLARVAQRVGRINRHTLVPSFHELLELARAAEDYSHSSVQSFRRASWFRVYFPNPLLARLLWQAGFFFFQLRDFFLYLTLIQHWQSPIIRLQWNRR
jgi:hypothetical protein